MCKRCYQPFNLQMYSLVKGHYICSFLMLAIEQPCGVIIVIRAAPSSRIHRFGALKESDLYAFGIYIHDLSNSMRKRNYFGNLLDLYWKDRIIYSQYRFFNNRILSK